MSDTDRQKKDHQGTDKKNQAMREQENTRVEKAAPPLQAKDEANLTDTEAGGAETRN